MVTTVDVDVTVEVKVELSVSTEAVTITVVVVVFVSVDTVLVTDDVDVADLITVEVAVDLTVDRGMLMHEQADERAAEPKARRTRSGSFSKSCFFVGEERKTYRPAERAAQVEAPHHGVS